RSTFVRTLCPLWSDFVTQARSRPLVAGLWARNGKNHIRNHAAIARRAQRLLEECRTDFLERPLRAKIILSRSEDHSIYELKGMLQHQRFQLAIVFAAPERPCQKGIANLNLALLRLEVMVSRTSDNSSRPQFNHSKRALRLDCTIKVALKIFALVAVRLRMLLPDKRIAGRRQERVEIFRPERA